MISLIRITKADDSAPKHRGISAKRRKPGAGNKSHISIKIIFDSGRKT